MKIKKIKINKKGFSLIELLTTILIISLIFGTGITIITNTISTSKEKAQTLALNNIKKTANTYIEEYTNDIAWLNDENEQIKNNYSCIAISSLINKGYISSKTISSYENISPSNYIITTRDESKNIINQEIDKKNKCTNNIEKVEIPTTKKYCNIIYYNGEEQKLVSSFNEKFIINQEQTQKKDAGNYTISAKLNKSNPINNKIYVWSDDKISDKEFTCTIRKKIPELNIEGEKGEDGTTLTDTKINLKSNTPGTLSIKTSDKSIATAIFDTDNTIESNTLKNITIKKYATKQNPTYITFTLTPQDTKNYAQTSTTYIIQKITPQEIEKPTCNKNLHYNFSYQNLVKEDQKYTITNNIQKEIGEYEVIIKLNYGYIWKDTKNKNDYQLKCKIEDSKLELSYNDNGGSGCSNQKKEIYYQKTYGTPTILCTPSREGYTFKGWNTEENGTGTTITNETIVNTKSNQTIHAKWEIKNYTLTYDSNGGSECNSQKLTHNEKIGTLCTTTKDGYIFEGWYTDINNGEKVTKETTISQNTTIYAHWKEDSNLTYTLSYNSNGGSYCKSKTLMPKSQFGELCTTTKSGYTFTGWYTDINNGEKVTEETTISQDTTLYAHWNKNSLAITYNANGGTGTTQKTTYTYGDNSKPTFAKNGFTKTGYTFRAWRLQRADGMWYGCTSTVVACTGSAGNTTIGWYSNNEIKAYYEPSGTGTWVFGTTMSKGQNITAYAQWRENVCTINYNPNGGTFTKNDNNKQKKITYTQSIDNMPNANGGTYSATHPQSYYYITPNKEWINGNTTYNQDKGYSATALCTRLNNGDQTITLKVNWSNSWYLCRKGDTCLNAIADWRDCSDDISKTNSNGEIRSFQITGTSGKYFTTTYNSKTIYIWQGCLRSSKTAAQTDCPNTCVG